MSVTMQTKTNERALGNVRTRGDQLGVDILHYGGEREMKQIRQRDFLSGAMYIISTA